MRHALSPARGQHERAPHRQPLRNPHRAPPARRRGKGSARIISPCTRATSRISPRRTNSSVCASYEVAAPWTGPAFRFVAFLTGCLLLLPVLPQTGYLHKRNGHPVTVSRRNAGNRKYAKVVQDQPRGVTLSAASRWCSGPSQRASSALQGTRAAHLPRHVGTHGRPDDRSGI